MSGWSEEQKLYMYFKDEYSTEVPPVSHHAWTRESWIRWIEGCGIWQPTDETRQCFKEDNAVEQAAIANARSRGE
jgi:hypothetical protein